MEGYPIAPDDCLVVRAISRSKTLREAARALGCDPSGLLRKVHRIAENHDLLAKIHGKWALTAQGQSVLAWTEESILSQRKILQTDKSIRIATPSWFSEQVLIPKMGQLSRSLKEYGDISLYVPPGGFEAALKAGQVDFVVASHPPEDPIVAHKKIISEDWIVVAPGKWKNELKGQSQDKVRRFLAAKPFIRHGQLSRDLILTDIDHSNKEISLTVDYLLGVRAGIIHGLGWSCVPRFLVKSALAEGIVAEVDLPVANQKEIRLWWLRQRSELKKLSSVIEAWVRSACQSN